MPTLESVGPCMPTGGLNICNKISSVRAASMPASGAKAKERGILVDGEIDAVKSNFARESLSVCRNL